MIKLVVVIHIVSFLAGVLVELRMDSEYRYVMGFERKHIAECEEAARKGTALPCGGSWRGLSYWDVEHTHEAPYTVITPKRWTKFLDPAEVFVVKRDKRGLPR